MPSSFGYGVSIPLIIKDKTGNVNDMDNYRAITLPRSLFETLVLEIRSDAMTTDPLRFGFQSNICCADAIVARKSTIKYFADKGSSAYIASLLIRKAFDTVNLRSASRRRWPDGLELFPG